MKKTEDSWTLREIIMTECPEIPMKALRAMEAAATPWKRKKGQAVVEQDEVCDRWIFVSKGFFRLMHEKNGKTDTLFFDGGGAVFTSFHGIVKGMPGVFRMEALTDGCGWSVPHAEYTRLCKEFPELRIFEINYLRHQLFYLEEYYHRQLFTSPQERYEIFWKRWTQVMNQDINKNRVLIRYIPLKVIAQYLNMTPQMLSRCRRRDAEANRNEKDEE